MKIYKELLATIRFTSLHARMNSGRPIIDLLKQAGYEVKYDEDLDSYSIYQITYEEDDK